MSAPRVEPSACTWCGIARRGHGKQFADAVGWHAWAAPSDAQILARMRARRLDQAVARMGASLAPVGPEPRDVEDELTGARLSLRDEGPIGYWLTEKAERLLAEPLEDLHDGPLTHRYEPNWDLPETGGTS